MNPINLVVLLLILFCLIIILNPKNLIEMFKPEIKYLKFEQDLIFKNKTILKNTNKNLKIKKYKFGKVIEILN